jgi:lysyl endopeptidase
MVKKVFLLIWASMLIPLLAVSQVSKPGIPPSFEPSARLAPVYFEQLPGIDLERMVMEDQAHDTIPDIPWRFGENISVAFNPDNSGSWHLLNNGDRVWRLGLQSPGALSINLTFDRYRLPPGAELYVYTPDRSGVIGAFTDYNHQEDGWFATTLLTGDAVVVEYFEPAGVSFPGELNLATLTHGYRSILSNEKIFGRSGPCNINVACPEAEGWDDPVDAVVLVLIGGNSICSGTMINNTENDGRPFMLTANHCFFNPANMVVWFNYQSETCVNPASPPPHDAMSGAVTRARYAPSDMWLVELNHPVPFEYRAFFAGWNRTLAPELNETVVSIHHPRGDIKKFSYALGGARAAAYLSSPGSGQNYWYVVWSGGTTTEPGSSGSALFDSRGRIIGKLHGGYAACGNTLPDWYGRLGISWTGGGTEATGLSYWLDPFGLDPQAIDGARAVWNVTVELEGLGYTSPTPGIHEVEFGDTVVFSARDGARWGFTHWIIDERIYASREVEMAITRHMTARAVFQYSRNGDGYPDPQQLIKAYPNPVTSGLFVEVEGIQGMVVLELFNVGGQKILSRREHGALNLVSRFSLDVGGLKPGIYFLRISGGGAVLNERIIIRD